MAATTSALRSRQSTEARNNPSAEWSSMEAAVEILKDAVSGGIPTWNNRSFTYYNATNNVHVVTYKLNSTTVATVTYTYVAAGVADDDDVLTEVLALA